MIEQQRARVRDLESSAKQWESRCADLKEAASSHEQRAKEASAEVLKGNQIIEKLTVRESATCAAALPFATDTHMRRSIWHAARQRDSQCTSHRDAGSSRLDELLESFARHAGM